MPQIDLSITSVFQQATGVVQAVLIGLLLCSILCWSVIVEKALVLRQLSRQAKAFAADGSDGFAQTLQQTGRRELEAVLTGESRTERRERAERAMRELAIAELARGQARLPSLATIGSSAPFIGLFGTVWGIMHSFASIAQANDTSLAVVAPGIAEALSTTAVGLAAAIPATIAYNKLLADFNGLSRQLSLDIARRVRQMDHAAEGRPGQ